MSFPEFTTRRLKLTRIHTSDATSLFELFSIPEVIKYYDLDEFTKIAQARKLIQLFDTRYESSTGIRWAIRTRESNQLIGTCGFNTWSKKMGNATIGYDLHPNHWNQGIMTEAAAEMIRAGFYGTLPCGNLHRVQADTIPGNIASEKVLLKLGFKEEGIRRESVCIGDTYYDMRCFGLLEPDFNIPSPNTTVKLKTDYA